MTDKTSRILIKTFIKTALKDADKTPARSSRNLIDMALRFSNGRFQHSFFEASRKILNNNRSPYYPLIEDTLNHMDKDKIVDFGMNLGYNGCTLGARLSRDLKSTENINVPWLLSLRIDSAHPDLLSHYQTIIDQGRELGIYVYFIFSDQNPNFVFPLIKQNKDCAMVLMCDSASINEKFAVAAESVNNLLIGVHYDNKTVDACQILRNHRLLYSLYHTYSEEDCSEILSGTYFHFAEKMHCPFAALLADSTCSNTSKEEIYQFAVASRTSQIYQTIPLDLIYDSKLIGDVISPPSNVIGFNSDGTLYIPGQPQNTSQFNIFQQGLKEILKEGFSI